MIILYKIVDVFADIATVVIFYMFASILLPNVMPNLGLISKFESAIPSGAEKIYAYSLASLYIILVLFVVIDGIKKSARLSYWGMLRFAFAIISALFFITIVAAFSTW